MTTSNQVRWSVTPAKAAKDTNIPDDVYCTLAVISTYTDENGYCYPKLATLAELRGVSRTQVARHIDKLISLGYMEKQPRYADDGARTSNLLRVIFDFPLNGGAIARPPYQTPVELGSPPTKTRQDLVDPLPNTRQNSNSNDTYNDANSNDNIAPYPGASVQGSSKSEEQEPLEDAEEVEHFPFQDAFTEANRPYANLYQELTGQFPGKGQVSDWQKAFNDMRAAGATLDDMRAEYEWSNFPVVRPGSLLGVMAARAGRRRVDSEAFFDLVQAADADLLSSKLNRLGK